MQTENKKQVLLGSGTRWVTWMKGLGMLYIVLFHWFDHFSTGLVKMAANLGAQGNHIFFTLSAFGLYWSLSKGKPEIFSGVDWRKWFAKRAQKLMIPYYISVVIVFSSIAAWGISTHAFEATCRLMHLNLQTALSTIFLYRNFIGSHSTAINTPWWFAITILQFYVLFPALCFLFHRKGWKWLAAGSFLVNAAYILYYAVILRSTNNAFNCFPLRFLFSFSMGLILCRFYLEDKAAFFERFTGPGAIALGLLLEGAGVALSFQGEAGKALNDLFFGFGIFLLTFNLIAFFAELKPVTNFFSAVGEYSLALFLLHTPYIALFFPRHAHTGLAQAVVYFAAYAAFLAVMAWSTTRFIFNKIPALAERRTKPAFTALPSDGRENKYATEGSTVS